MQLGDSPPGQRTRIPHSLGEGAWFACCVVLVSHRHYHLSSWSSLAPRRARSGSQPRRTWGQAHELCSDRALRRPAVARCAAPPRAAPMSFPAFRCLHPKRAVALLGHQASGETALQKYRHAGTLKQAGLGVWGMRQHGESTRSCERPPPNKHTPQTPTFPLQRPMARDTRSRSPR